ncbi:MAG: hypothetical protein VR65_14200 [Desulfobulbaceae bacterium BRH_c16a]|nr:MAG: hypothetical protein VR65_14200 [Desulfobulbaceae bacterium BRH_c16a]
MKKLFLILTGMLLPLLFSINAATAALTVYTEEFPPFQYKENDKIIGASAEVVEAVLKSTGLDFEIASYPWARSYQLVQEKADSLIFSMSRQEKREALFKWIGIIVPSRYSVFALQERSDLQIGSLEDMKKYKIGTTLSDARESYLESKGFDLGTFDRTSGDNANLSNYKKLKAKRIDLWPMPDAVAFHIAKSAGDDPGTLLRRALPLTEISTGGYYLAASLQTSDDTVKTIRTVLENFVKTDEYKAILAKWGIE